MVAECLVDDGLYLGVGGVEVAEALAEVAGGDVEDVHALDLQDLVQVVHGQDVLDEDDGQALVVGPLVEVRDPVALARGGHAALAHGNELGGVGHGLGLLAGVHVRHADALGAEVEHAVDGAVAVFVDAHDGGHAPDVGGARLVGDVPVVQGPVFAFQPDGVEAERAQPLDQIRGHPGAHDAGGQFSGSELVLDAVGSH